MARQPPSALYKTIVEAESVVDFGRLSSVLTGTDPIAMATKVLALAAVWSGTLTRLGKEIRGRQDRCRREPCPKELVNALSAVRRMAEATGDAVGDLNWVFARIKQGGVSLNDERDAIKNTRRDLRRACDDLSTGLAQLKPMVAPAQAARQRRSGIRADIERDAG